MQQFLSVINLVLAQTPQEKRLTLLFVGVFMFILMLLIIDGFNKKEFISNKILLNITWFLFLITAVAFIVLNFVL